MHDAGLTVVAVNADRLTVKGPAPTIAAWRVFIREHKPQLLAELRPTRAVVSYDLIGDKGGLLIDPDGPASAVRELAWRFGTGSIGRRYCERSMRVNRMLIARPRT